MDVPEHPTLPSHHNGEQGDTNVGEKVARHGEKGIGIRCLLPDIVGVVPTKPS
ncbi:hypothetical protein D3C77_772440 [compost metagenome]